MIIVRILKIIQLVFALSFFTVLYGQTKTSSNQMDHKNREINLNSAGKAWNAVCPVRGGEVDSKVEAVEYNGKYFGFCCGGCDAKFKKNPAKYSKNLSDDGKRFVGKKS